MIGREKHEVESMKNNDWLRKAQGGVKSHCHDLESC